MLLIIPLSQFLVYSLQQELPVLEEDKQQLKPLYTGKWLSLWAMDDHIKSFKWLKSVYLVYEAYKRDFDFLKK